MVRKLYGNHFGFTRDKDFDTFAKNKNPGPYPRLMGRAKYSTWQSPESSATGSPSQGLLVPTSGKFVGMIVHVQFNDLALVDTDYVVYRQNYPWVTADQVEIGRVHVPGGEIGCFYSDPDTSDASRSFASMAVILIEMFISAGGSMNAGIKGQTMHLAFDFDDDNITCPGGTTLTNGICVPDP